MYSRRINFRDVLSAVVLLFVLFCVCTDAQELTSRPDQGLAGNGTRAVSEIDSINLQNGGVSLSLPLASLPPMAGGKLGYTLTANYNSKLWMAYRKEVLAWSSSPSTCPGSFTSTEIRSADGTAAGWNLGRTYEIFFRDARDDNDYLIPSSECDYIESMLMQGAFFKPMLRMPDGSERELQIEGSFPQYAGERGHLRGYYKATTWSEGQPVFSSPVRFYTTDGTYLTIVYNLQSETTKWTIYMKDGTRIEKSDAGQRTIDTNGNSILQGYNALGGYAFARDERTGREIKWSGSTYNGQSATKVEYQSLGGAWQTVWVVWGTTTVQGNVSYTQIESINGGTFGCWAPFEQNIALPVIREIILPSTETGVTRKYEFDYNSDTTEQATENNYGYSCAQTTTYTRQASNGWGQVSRITTPDGATYDYEYVSDGLHTLGNIAQGGIEYLSRQMIEKKTVTHDGEENVWNYTIDLNGAGGTVTNPDGSSYVEEYIGGLVWGLNGGGSGLGGLLRHAKQSGRILTEKHWTLRGGDLYAFGSDSLVTFNPVVDIEYTTLLAADGVTRIKMTARKFTYDYNGDLKETIEYDWFNLGDVTYIADINNPFYSQPAGIPSSAQVLRVSTNSYYNSAAAASDSTAYHKRTVGTSTVILGKPKSSVVSLSSTVKARSEFYYDSAYNLRETRVWDSTKGAVSNPLTGGNSISTSEYAANGNVIETTDANENVTVITYGCVDGSGSCDDEYENLYPTQTVVASGTSVARTSSVIYDFSTGLPLSGTDEDNDLTNSSEYDILGRPIKAISAQGATGFESWVMTEYNDAARRIIVRADLETKGDGKKVAVQHFDQLGRVRLSRTLENPWEDPTNETHGIKVETRYKATGYACPWDDQQGAQETCSAQLVSNPYRADYSYNAGSEPTMGWTITQAQNNGRRSEAQTFGGAALPKPFLTSGFNTNSTGTVRTDIDADRTLVTDQAGKQRISKTNALGQLKDIWEVTASDANTEAVTFGNPAVNLNGYKTSYSYDTLNNLTAVNQGSQTRTFIYSSLSRLLSATNPESATISYGYDSNGNLTSKVDARNITTSYAYDVLNRVTLRDYSDSTPDVSYFYDNLTNAKGKLTKVSSTVSTTEYTAFDILGRVTAHKQTTDGTAYTTGYKYNLSGVLIEETYPSGRVIKNVLDAEGDLSIVLSKKNSSAGFWTYANSFTYNAAGAATSLQLGNGRWESTQFNSRLQPTQIALGTTGSGTLAYDLLKLNYGYGTTANNGNVQSQTITVSGTGGFTTVQNYAY